MSIARIGRTFLSLLGLLCLGSTNIKAGIVATATYTETIVSPGTYEYDLTLNNTGTTTIGTFWFGWLPGAGFLSSAPTGVVSPAGWTDTVTNGGDALRWTTTSDLLSPGGSLSGFDFDSTETPSELLGTVPSGLGAGDPVTTSFVYIAAPLADPGYQLTATAATPEPASFWFGLMAICLGGIGRLLSRRSRLITRGMV